jgi:hypothetical protein
MAPPLVCFFQNAYVFFKEVVTPLFKEILGDKRNASIFSKISHFGCGFQIMNVSFQRIDVFFSKLALTDFMIRLIHNMHHLKLTWKCMNIAFSNTGGALAMKNNMECLNSNVVTIEFHMGLHDKNIQYAHFDWGPATWAPPRKAALMHFRALF